MKIYKSLIISFLFLACGNEKYTPLPKTDLAARNEVIQDVKKQVLEAKTASPNKALSLLNHSDYRVRRAAIKRLGALKSAPKPAVDALLTSLKDSSADVRVEAAIALNLIESEAAIEPLIQALVDNDNKVRQWSYKALKKLGNRAVPKMIDQLSPNTGDAPPKSKRLQEILMETLSGMGTAAVPHLIKALEKNQTASAVDAVNLLGKIGRKAKTSIYVLIELLNNDNSIELKTSAIDAISRIGDVDPEVVPTLFEFAEGKNKSLATAAKKALKKLEEES